jgi:hypothetical protein
MESRGRTRTLMHCWGRRGVHRGLNLLGQEGRGHKGSEGKGEGGGQEKDESLPLTQYEYEAKAPRVGRSEEGGGSGRGRRQEGYQIDEEQSMTTQIRSGNDS